MQKQVQTWEELEEVLKDFTSKLINGEIQFNSPHLKYFFKSSLTHQKVFQYFFIILHKK